MIEQVQAQLLVLQEVGSLATLECLNEQLANPYPFASLVPGNSTRSIHIGVLSRYPCQLTSHRQLPLTQTDGSVLLQLEQEGGQPQPARLQRDIVQITTGYGDLALTLFAVHLKSRINQAWQIVDAQTIRAAEVTALCSLVEALKVTQPEQAVVVLGDFNDQPDAALLQPLEGLGLIDLHGQAAAARGFNPTTYWPKRHCRFDRILLNSVAADLFVPDSAMMHGSRMAQQASDHYPVSLVLKVAGPDS